MPYNLNMIENFYNRNRKVGTLQVDHLVAVNVLLLDFSKNYALKEGYAATKKIRILFLG